MLATSAIAQAPKEHTRCRVCIAQTCRASRVAYKTAFAAQGSGLVGLLQAAPGASGYTWDRTVSAAHLAPACAAGDEAQADKGGDAASYSVPSVESGRATASAAEPSTAPASGTSMQVLPCLFTPLSAGFPSLVFGLGRDGEGSVTPREFVL